MSRKKFRSVKGVAPAQVQNKYDAGGTGRRMRGFMPSNFGPNAAASNVPLVQSRIRDLRRNEWSPPSVVRAYTVNTVGTGIVPRPKTDNTEMKRRHNELWTRFVRTADADCVLDFYGLTALIARAKVSDGEAFIRLRWRRLSDGLPVPLQLQVLESDFVPRLDADVYPELPKGNYIREGVEFDRIGRRVAYWMFRAHPGERKGLTVNANELYRVPASEVMHVFEPLRPGQIRGVSDLAPVVTRLKNTGDFDDAVLERQRIANLFVSFITQATPTPGVDPITMKPLSYDGAPGVSMEPGATIPLLPGESVEFTEPPDAGAGYEAFMRWQYLGVGAGIGVPYEILTGDAKDISDRTLRVLMDQFKRGIEQQQWLMFIPQFCQRVREAFGVAAVLAGEIPTSEVEEVNRVEWAPQAWPYMHPVQDVQARVMEIDAGIRSRQSVQSERGEDPEQVALEREQDAERDKAAGLTPPAPAPANAGPSKGNTQKGAAA